MYAIRHSLALLGLCGAVFFTAAPASAQCTYQWLPGEGLPGLNDAVHALTVYNGELIAGGRFTTAGGAPANRIARWDGTAWSPLGSGINDRVYGLTVHNGELIAGGSFTTAGGVPANRVAHWDGTQWSALGSGVNSTVLALTVTTAN